MSGTVSQLVGGPLDGTVVRVRRKASFVWVDAEDGYLYVTARPGRHLYRRGRGKTGYLYAGHSHAVCSGCGTFHERVDGHVVECSLCGSGLEAQT